MGIYEGAEIYGLRICYYTEDDNQVTVFETVQETPMTTDEIQSKITECKTTWHHRMLKYYVLRKVSSTLDLAINSNKTYYMWFPYSIGGK